MVVQREGEDRGRSELVYVDDHGGNVRLENVLHVSGHVQRLGKQQVFHAVSAGHETQVQVGRRIGPARGVGRQRAVGLHGDPDGAGAGLQEVGAVKPQRGTALLLHGQVDVRIGEVVQRRTADGVYLPYALLVGVVGRRHAGHGRRNVYGEREGRGRTEVAGLVGGVELHHVGTVLLESEAGREIGGGVADGPGLQGVVPDYGAVEIGISARRRKGGGLPVPVLRGLLPLHAEIGADHVAGSHVGQRAGQGSERMHERFIRHGHAGRRRGGVHNELHANSGGFDGAVHFVPRAGDHAVAAVHVPPVGGDGPLPVRVDVVIHAGEAGEGGGGEPGHAVPRQVVVAGALGEVRAVVHNAHGHRSGVNRGTYNGRRGSRLIMRHAGVRRGNGGHRGRRLQGELYVGRQRAGQAGLGDLVAGLVHGLGEDLVADARQRGYPGGRGDPRGGPVIAHDGSVVEQLLGGVPGMGGEVPVAGRIHLEVGQHHAVQHAGRVIFRVAGDIVQFRLDNGAVRRVRDG